MSNSLVNSPNSSFETEDTIKMNSSIISSSASNSHVNLNAVGNGLMNHSNFSLMDQFYQVDNSSFNPLPPPPPISISQSTSSSFSSASSTSAFNNNPQYITASSAPSSTESGVHFHPADGSFLPQPDVTEQQVELQDVTEVHLAPPNNEFFLGNDYSLPNSSYHSVFSNGQAMNSVNSLHDTQSHPQMFKLDSTTDLLNDYSISNMQSSDLMYNLTEFELGNPSLDSIPDAMHNIHIHQNMSLQHLPSSLKDSSSNYSNAVAPSHNAGYPYTPNVTDVYTPPLSDSSSFTPNSTTSTNMQIANISNLAQFNDDVIRPPPSISLKNLTFSNSTPNLHSRKVTKKPSMNRINNNTVMSNKKNLVISTQIANSANPNHSMASSSSHGNTPLSESSPQLLGISPLCNKYKGLEIYQASPTASRSISNASNISAFTTSSVNDSPQIPNKNLMPPLNIFRHNSDSGSSFSSYYETPKRKTSSSLADVSAQKSKKQMAQQIQLQQQQQQQQMQQHLQLQLQQHQHVRHLNEDHNSLSNDSVSNVDGTIGMLKPKKYTRRRLLPRSKNGCWICRIKHLKCDENRPECSSCVKFGIECDYSLNKPDYVLDKNMRKVKLGDISILRKQKQATSKSHKSKVKIEHTDHDKQKLLQQIAHESQLQSHQQHMHSGMIQSHETNNYSSVSAE